MREREEVEGKRDERRKSGGQWEGKGLRGKIESGKEKEQLSEEQEREDDKR